jgi:hypothetical protein
MNGPLGIFTLAFELMLAMLLADAPVQSPPATAPSLSPAATQPAGPLSVDDLPDALLHGDVLGVIVLDLKTGDKTAWNDALMVISGGRPATHPLGPNDPLPMGLDGAIGPFFRFGAERLCVAMVNNHGNVDPAIAVRLKDGADPAPAERWFRQNVQGQSVAHDGNWCFCEPRDLRDPNSTPLNPQADAIRLALNCWGDDVPIKVVYITSDTIQRDSTRPGPPPAPVADLFNLYWSVKYVYIGARLGAEPLLYVRWVAPDSDGADAVVKAWNELPAKLRQQNNTGGLLQFGPVYELIKPVREDNAAVVTMDRKLLANAFGVVLATIAIRQQQGGAQQTPVGPDWQPTDPASDAAAAQMRLILAAIAEYDAANHALPTSLDDLTKSQLVPGAEIFHDPRTNQDNGFIYQPPAGVTKLADIPTPDKAAILFESKDGKPDQTGLIGYANGQVKTRQ